MFLSSVLTLQRRVLIFFCIGGLSVCHAGVNYEEAPINYRTTPPSNAITRLQQKIDDGTVTLQSDDAQGYLKSLLAELDIPASSQVMPYAKISRQNPRISPTTPRAIYFNNDIHMGFVQGGLIEIAVTDPNLGMAFYTLEQTATDKPTFRNDSSSCLTCHGTARTRNVPGLQVRSVVPDVKGEPVVAAGSFRTDHTSPFDKRWGGWYVTGKHGSQQHLGNFVMLDPKKPKLIDNAAGQNVSDLSTLFDTTKYLTPYSDIVALLVLEHQADALNFVTTANFEARHAMYVETEKLKEPNADAASIQKATQNRIDKSAETLVRYLLFSGEAPLNGPISGASPFAQEFVERGPKDKQGRSLREFDLDKRIFKYPCSYVIYSDAFQALPDIMKQRVYQRLQQVLTSQEPPKEYAHLSNDARQSIVEILNDTKPDFASAQSQVTTSQPSTR